MASGIRSSQRVFALTMAVVFLLTTVATSAFVIWAIIDENKDKSSSVTTSEQNAATTNPLANQQQCAFNVEPGQQTLLVPEIYKPPADVTDLEIIDVQQGSGNAVQSGDCLVVKYYGTLATSGEKFDENFTSDQGLVFEVGKGNVIPGWDQGLMGMKVGGTRRLTIPSDLAYGTSGQGSIPANADLVFVVKLVEVR